MTTHAIARDAQPSVVDELAGTLVWILVLAGMFGLGAGHGLTIAAAGLALAVSAGLGLSATLRGAWRARTRQLAAALMVLALAWAQGALAEALGLASWDRALQTVDGALYGKTPAQVLKDWRPTLALAAPLLIGGWWLLAAASFGGGIVAADWGRVRPLLLTLLAVIGLQLLMPSHGALRGRALEAPAAGDGGAPLVASALRAEGWLSIGDAELGGASASLTLALVGPLLAMVWRRGMLARTLVAGWGLAAGVGCAALRGHHVTGMLIGLAMGLGVLCLERFELYSDGSPTTADEGGSTA